MNDTYYWIVVIFNIVWIAFLCFMHHWSRQDDDRDDRARGIHKRRAKAIERTKDKYQKLYKKLAKKAIRSVRQAYVRGDYEWRMRESVPDVYNLGSKKMDEIFNKCIIHCTDKGIDIKGCSIVLHQIVFKNKEYV